MDAAASTSLIRGAGKAGVLRDAGMIGAPEPGQKQGWGRGRDIQSLRPLTAGDRAGTGRGWSPHPEAGHQQTRQTAGLQPSCPAQAGTSRGLGRSCLAEQFQVGDRDLALLVAPLADEPVGVHARQAVDSDELKRKAEREGRALAG